MGKTKSMQCAAVAVTVWDLGDSAPMRYPRWLHKIFFLFVLTALNLEQGYGLILTGRLLDVTSAFYFPIPPDGNTYYEHDDTFVE